MSVVVRDMQMPKSCGSCDFVKSVSSSIGTSLECPRIGMVAKRFDDKYDVLNKRHPNCPLFEVKAWEDI